MKTNTFTEDIAIAQSILKRDGIVTREYLYKKCYPLFKSIYDNYYTDSNEVREFINEVYLLILTPSKETGQCQLENYRGESTLATWLKTACLFYCYHKYKKKIHIRTVDLLAQSDDNDGSDRLLDNSHSTTMDTSLTDRSDLNVIIDMMPNERYRQIIRLRYMERKTNEETAKVLNMTMANYYNKHKLAKEQFIRILKKEEHDA